MYPILSSQMNHNFFLKALLVLLTPLFSSNVGSVFYKSGVSALTIYPPSGQNSPSSLLGRESDAMYFANKGSEWVSSPSPAGGIQWNQYYSYTDPMLPTDLAEPRFQVFYPIDGSYIIPDTVTYVTWNTIAPTISPAIAYPVPTDVMIYLYNVDSSGFNLDQVQVVAHSVPNQGVWLWVARVPRAWSNDAMYTLRICSAQDTHICSDSPYFRILNPYAFYP